VVHARSKVKSVTGWRYKKGAHSGVADPLIGPTCSTISPLPADWVLRVGTFNRLFSLRNNNKRRTAMFKRSKVRQAGLILFATTLILILPNLNRLFG